ncbi:putative 5-epiaristolochene 1,3-dihydroxylase-like [Capsicum annuum]|nr:putative 5-epiaristolochene 1,3-dihydroxylase-like [Capsicum annuum]
MDNSFGCVLGQHDVTGKKEQAIYYLSKKFTAYEARYTLLERTCCALTWLAQKLKHYLSSYTTYLISRMNPLKYIFQKPMPMGRLNPIDEEYKPLKTHFPDEEVSCVDEVIIDADLGWRLFFDGAINMKGFEIGAVFISELGQYFSITAQLRFYYTNNMTEYEACILGLRQWHEKLLFALLGYRTTVRTSTGATPYLLVYGTEAIILAKVKIPSLRVIVEAEIDNDEWVKARLEHLSLIEEKRPTSVCHGQLYQRRITRAYNKKVRPRNFEVGQLVLRRILSHQVEAKGKFSPNWQGPFVVKKAVPNGALYLTDIEGKMGEMAINADADPPEKWDFTFCSGPSWKMGCYFMFRAADKNLNGTSFDSPTRYSPSPSNPLRYLSLDPLITWVGKTAWPELLGQYVDKAVSIIQKENPTLRPVVLNISQDVPDPDPVDCTRVLIFINDNKQVALVPINAVPFVFGL